MEEGDQLDECPIGVKFCRAILHPIFALCAFVSLLSVVGWTGEVITWQHWVTTVTGVAFAMERFWVFYRLKPRGKERRRLLYHLALAAAVFIFSIVLLARPLLGADHWSLGGHLFIQFGIIVSGLFSLIHKQTKLTARMVHPGLILIGSFFAIIVAGTLLLKMPRCVTGDEPCSWIDAVFTSTSAVCVTGLALENTAHFFSTTGQCVILLLIQIGGLGIMTLTFCVAIVMSEGISLHDRMLLGRMIQENRLSRVGRTLAFTVGMTFALELAGAVFLYAGLVDVPDTGERIFQSVFHSVSAFCNAGFSTFPDGLASKVVANNGVWQVCVMVLIVIGGLGSLVVEDLCHWSMIKMQRLRGVSGPRPRLRVHTRLVLLTTAVLIFGGALLLYLSEFVFWNGEQNGGGVLTALFHSVTARTAGFNTVPVMSIGPLTVQILMVLMLIGGSPGGTAGGLRTTVVAVGLRHLWCHLRASARGIVVFNRRIPESTGARALGLMVLAVIWLIINFVIFQVLETGSGITESHLLFELISAFATVGLSLDLTPNLSEGGKILLIINMFVGRIGLLTVMATLIPPDPRPASGKPAEDILLT